MLYTITMVLKIFLLYKNKLILRVLKLANYYIVNVMFLLYVCACHHSLALFIKSQNKLMNLHL